MSGTPDVHFAFDVGHSSIGWAVLKTANQSAPELLGCGSVIFPPDDCLAAERRGFRRQRRHIRATRLRIARLRRLLAHLGLLTEKQLEAPGCAWPWLLAARVLRGGKTLSWPELWDVLRWYAHNRGYDGNKGWSRHEADAADDNDTEKEKRAGELLDNFRVRHGRSGTMAEVFCDVLKVDPLGPVKASMERVRGLGAAFPREGVEAEVERILRAHLGVLAQVDERLIECLMRDNTALPGPQLRLPKRYGQRVNGLRTPGGLLFGQLVPRFDNRIIATCPITYQRVFECELAATGDEERARHQAQKLAKVPGAECTEFRRFRWAMQLANVQVATGDSRQPRRLTILERADIDKVMRDRGALTANEFKKAVRAVTGGAKDNLDQMLVHPDAAKALILDPAQELAGSGAFAVIWPHLDERARAHTRTNLRRGKTITIRALLVTAPAAESAFTKWFDGESLRKRKNPKGWDESLDQPHRIKPESGRAPYTRNVMREACDDVFQRGIHPADEGGVLFRSEAIRNAQLRRALDEQTNNHLVRHRLKLLERLHADLLKAYAGDDTARVARVTIEVNRDLKQLSGKTAQEQAKDLGQRLANFKSVVKKLEADFDGKNVRITPGLIRKARVAEDLAWTCPYTGKTFDAFDLLYRRVDKDHVVPRSDRVSDSLDSLVITFAEVNKMKGRRTAALFIEECQSQPVPGLPNVTIKPLIVYLKDIGSLETFKGHDEDQRRKKRRKQLLALRDYVEKEFVPRDLTQTSQLVRLGAQALQRHYLGLAQPPVIISLPGSVTGAVRKSWDLIGCLGMANPLIFDEENMPRTKTEIRGITHLHHALDACVLAFASILLPRDAWELLVKRRLNPDEQRRARISFGAYINISNDGELRLADLSPQIKEQIRARLAERRVVQHLPADPSGLECKETVWRVFDPADPHHSTRRLARWLQQAKVIVPAPDAKTVLIICRKRRSAADSDGAGGKVLRKTETWRWVFDIKDKSALLGFEPDGDPAQAKLKKLKAVKVLGDNFGLGLDPQPTLIRPHKVWPQLQKLRSANGGKPVRVLRKGILVRVPKRGLRPKYEGVWMLRGVTLNQRAGFLVDLSPADQIIYRRQPGCLENISVATLLKCGLEVLKAPLCGLSPTQT